MSGLISHATAELDRAGLFDTDGDYGGMIGKAVMELMHVFANQGHSGFSARLTLQIFEKVASYKPLGPVTSDPEEWFFHGTGFDQGKDLWQNKRQGSCFSNDGGKTYYDIDAGDDRAIKTAVAP